MIDGRYKSTQATVSSARSPAPRRFNGFVFTFVIALVFVSFSSVAFAQIVPSGAAATTVRIGVLGLFHSRELRLSTSPGQALIVRAGGERIVLEHSSGVPTTRIRLSGGEILLQAGLRTVRAPVITVAGRKNEPADFALAVPGKIARHYTGTLEIRPSAGYLLAIVTMDRETAVASIVAAENPTETPFEALKAQAVATRSYLAAGRGRHRDFDFCDTTHCQFLREPPALGSVVEQAVEATRDMLLVYESKPFAAMYTRSCGGHTRTPAELGLPESTYPYYSVECKYCRAHPARWSSRVSSEDAALLHSSNEPARLGAARRLGWNTIPSNDFVVKKTNDHILVEGVGHGHGIGLCQAGSKAMAAQGADFRQILNHYYPNSTVVIIHTAAGSISQAREATQMP